MVLADKLYYGIKVELEDRELDRQEKLIKEIGLSGNFSNCFGLKPETREECLILSGITTNNTLVCPYVENSMCKYIVTQDYQACEEDPCYVISKGSGGNQSCKGSKSYANLCKQVLESWRDFLIT